MAAEQLMELLYDWFTRFTQDKRERHGTNWCKTNFAVNDDLEFRFGVDDVQALVAVT